MNVIETDNTFYKFCEFRCKILFYNMHLKRKKKLIFLFISGREKNLMNLETRIFMI